MLKGFARPHPHASKSPAKGPAKDPAKTSAKGSAKGPATRHYLGWFPRNALEPLRGALQRRRQLQEHAACGLRQTTKQCETQPGRRPIAPCKKKSTTNFTFSVAASQVRDSCCDRHRSVAASTTVTCVPCAVLDTISSHHPLHCLSAAPLGGRQRVLLMGF